MKSAMFLSVLFLLTSCVFAAQEFQLSPLFSDGAVFQQKADIPVWGKYEKSKTVLKAEFAGTEVYTKTSSTGEFMFRLPPQNAGGPYQLVITDPAANKSVTVSDILVGEVWIASGQSNMEYALGSNWIVKANRKKTGENLNEIQLKEYTSTIKQPERMRFFQVPRNSEGIPENTVGTKWEYVNAKNAPRVSAAAAWFARELQEKLNVPVGLIVTVWGGTPVEAWTSRAALLKNPETKDMMRNTDLLFGEKESWGSPSEKNAWKKDTGNKGVGLGYAKADFDDSKWKYMIVPGSWIKQKISGNGSVWFRKEIQIPEQWKGCELILHTGGIDKHDISYFNGTEIGRTGKDTETDFWDRPRAYRIPAELVKPGKNVIAIRGYSFVYDGAFTGTEKAYRLENKTSGETISISGIWKGFPETNLGIVSRTAKPGPGNARTPAVLFNGMVRPLIPYAIRGAIWYQGEANTQDAVKAAAYQERLATMIKDWRFRWEQGDFPFIQMQLAFYNPANRPHFDMHSPWAFLRDSQRKLCKQLPNVFLASVIDCGDPLDVHPQDKKTVGKRFAAAALHNVYHCPETVPAGPEFDSFTVEGDWIRLVFKNGEGLNLKQDFRKSFYIASDNQIFVPADEIVIEGNSVRVHAKGIRYPVAVRYAWSIAPVSSLYNKAGLPASSFRTDSWHIK